MQTLFYVSRGGQSTGPWTIEEIAARLAKAELAATDFLYDESKAEWVPFLESHRLVSAIRSRAPMAPPPPTVDASLAAAPPPPAEAEEERRATAPLAIEYDGETPEWLVKRGARVYGPFTYFGLIRALQEKSVFPFDLIHKGHDARTNDWTRVAEREEFHADRLRAIVETRAAPLAEAFVERRHVRRSIEQDAIVHDNKKTWIGKTFEGSEGGCGITVRNALLSPGQVVHIHFGKAEGLPPFNALCEVISKRFVPDMRDSRTPVQYGVKFLQIDPRAVQAAREYFTK